MYTPNQGSATILSRLDLQLLLNFLLFILSETMQMSSKIKSYFLSIKIKVQRNAILFMLS